MKAVLDAKTLYYYNRYWKNKAPEPPDKCPHCGHTGTLIQADKHTVNLKPLKIPDAPKRLHYYHAQYECPNCGHRWEVKW